MAYLILIFFAPVVGMLSYYLGMILMTKTKMKQTDNNFGTHLLRILFGLLMISAVGIILLSLFYIIKS